MSNNNDDYKKVIGNLLHISNLIKVYHWQTLLYARHKATDDLYSKFNSLTDRFVEVLNGNLISINQNNRISVNDYNITLIDINDNNGVSILKITMELLKSDLFTKVIGENTDLITIRDEMIELINTNYYLFTMK
jgi:hypothetical protein